MPRKTEKHVHKLKRLKYKSGNSIFFCVLPDCSYKTNVSLALGKRSICWRCGESFIMSEYSLRLAKPHCDSCHRLKVEKAEDIVKQELENPIFHHLTLAERLQQTIQQAKKEAEEDI